LLERLGRTRERAAASPAGRIRTIARPPRSPPGREPKHMLRAIGCIVVIVFIVGLLVLFGLLDAVF
jgi:hypothetical protein